MKPAAATFEARIYRIGQLRCVDVPERVSKKLGAAPRIPVRVRIGEHEGQTNLVRTREGGHRLYLAAALRRRIPRSIPATASAFTCGPIHAAPSRSCRPT